MNKRTIYLLIGVAAVALFYFGDLGYRTYVDAPAKKQANQIKKLDKQITQANKLIARIPATSKQLDSYERLSLPTDRETTRTAYQNWLLSAVKSNGLQQASVEATLPSAITINRRGATTSRVKTKTVLVRYSYSLSCRGSLNQFVEFLYQFYRSGHLHKIRSMALNPSSDGKRIDARMTIEAISLNRSERESELADVKVNRPAKSTLIEYARIAQRNIFSRKGDQSLYRVRLSGITFSKNGEPNAWIQIDDKLASRQCSNEDTLSIGDHQIEILDIQSELVYLLVDGIPVKLELGHSLKDVLDTGTDALESDDLNLEPSTPELLNPESIDQISATGSALFNWRKS